MFSSEKMLGLIAKTLLIVVCVATAQSAGAQTVQARAVRVQHQRNRLMQILARLLQSFSLSISTRQFFYEGYIALGHFHEYSR